MRNALSCFRRSGNFEQAKTKKCHMKLPNYQKCGSSETLSNQMHLNLVHMCQPAALYTLQCVCPVNEMLHPGSSVLVIGAFLPIYAHASPTV